MIIIGIDHDLHKHGVAVFNMQSKVLLTQALDTTTLLASLSPVADDIFIIMEGSWEVTGHYGRYNKRTMKVNAAMRMANNIMENHRAGKELYDKLIAIGYQVKLIKPINKKLFKKDGAWFAHGREMFERIFSISGRRINDDVRDAVLIVNHIIDITYDRRRNSKPYTNRDCPALHQVSPETGAG